MRVEREKYDKEHRQAQAEGEIEGYKQAKIQRSFQVDQQKELLGKDKVQAEVMARLKFEREKYARDLKHEMSRMRADSSRSEKSQQRTLNEMGQRDLIESQKEKSDMLSHV
jgi:hypothetical protein